MTKPYKCRVEYLESTGTQWIDTGIAPSNITPVAKLKFIPTQQCSSGNYGIFGCFGANNTRFQIFYNSIGIGTYVSKLWQTNTTYEVELNGKTPSATINGSVETSGYSKANGFSSYNMYLFTRNNGDVADNGVPLKLYYCKIWDNNTLVRDMIPVLDNSGRPAMYDQVSGQLFYNQGSGEFTYGRQIIPVEYLESTGTQYIDTGIKGKNNLHYKTKVNFTTLSTSGSNGIGGEYLANASAYIGMVRANGHYTYLFNNTSVETTTTIYANTDYEIDSVMNSGSQVLRVNGETISNGTLSGTFTSTRNIFLYAVCSTNDAADVYGSLKMYYCQIYDNDTLVRDFIPCIDENLTPFMFDLVTNTCYLNAGTGQFKVGPNVEKVWGGKKLRRKLALALANLKKKRPYYCEVECLQNKTTSDYISTGIYYDWSKNATVNTVFSIPSLDKRYVIAGSYTGSGLNLEVSENGRCRMYGNGGTPNVYTTKTIQANEKVEIIFKRNYPDTEMTIITPRWIETVSLENVTQTAVSATTLNLFRDTRATFGLPIIYKFYIKIGDLEKDFIPVLDLDYHPCMYEKNASEFYYDENSSDMYGFIAGREIHYVDYLEADGTQYIDTGLNYFADFEVGIKLRNNVSNKALGNTQTNCMERNNATSHNWRFSSNGSWDSNIDLLEYHVMKWKEDKIYADDVLLTEKVKIKNTGYYMTLFGAGAYYPNMIYFCKLWNPDDGTLVRNYIPAIDENGVGFLFDKVSHTIYDNAGTGVFKYSARETEYTANAATLAYIDLGVKYKPSMNIEGKYTRDNYGTNGSVMLLTTTTTAPLIYLPALSGTSTERFVWRRGGYTEQSYFINNIQYPFTCEMKVDAVNDTLTLNGNIVKTGMIAGMNGYDSPYESASNMYMFSIANGYAGNGKIYYLKIIDGTTPLFDLIPAYKDGEAGFYNKVDGTFYKNASAHSNAKLTAGKIIEPEYE